MQVLVNKRNATNKDIIREMVKISPLAVKQVSSIAEKFRGRTLEETCKNVFYYALNNIPYKEDPENRQIIKMPLKALRDAKKGIPTDCKTFSIFCGSILKALGYNAKYKFASYDEDPTPSHVYCICEGYIIDPVYKKFNREKPYKYMQLQVINGIGYTELRPVAGIKDIWNKVKDTVKTTTGAAAGAAKTAGLALPRLAFLGLIDLNVLNLAYALNQARNKGKESKLAAVWKKFGGDPSKLWGAVNKGKGRKPIAKGLGPKVSGIGAEPVTMATVTTAIATATPIIIAIVSALKSEGVKIEENPLVPNLATQGELDSGSLKNTLNTVLSTASQLFTQQTGITPQEQAQTMLTTETPSESLLSQADNESPTTEKKGLLSSPLVLIGGGLLAAKLLKLF